MNYDLKCNVCGGKMTILFLSAVCDYCERPTVTTSGDGVYLGWIVWRSRPPGSCEYVFKTKEDLKKWRTAAGLDRFPMRQVRSDAPFTWRSSTGSVPNIILADRLFEVFEHVNDAKGPNSVSLSGG